MLYVDEADTQQINSVRSQFTPLRVISKVEGGSIEAPCRSNDKRREMLLVKLVYNSNIMKTLIKLKAIDYEGGLDTLFGSQLKTKVKQIKDRRTSTIRRLRYN